VVVAVARGGWAVVVDGGGSLPSEGADDSPVAAGSSVGGPAAGLQLGTLLQSEARSAGHGSDWRAYAAGRLLLPRQTAAPIGLLAEPVPGDAAAGAAAAARWQVDPDLLWLIVRTAIEDEGPTRGPPKR
jgi:hypothetical protein